MKFGIFTFFNASYINQGIALLQSVLKQEIEIIKVIVYPLDEKTKEVLTSWFGSNEKVTIRSATNEIREVTNGTDEIKKRHHFYLLKPFLFSKTIKENGELDWIFYLDADLYHFKPCLYEMINHSKSKSVILSKHTFSHRTSGHEIYGRLNAGFIGINSRAEEGRGFIFRWAAECLKTFATMECEFDFSDQKVLDLCAGQETDIFIVDNLGINQSTWILDHIFTPKSLLRVRKLIQELKIFHFHGFKDSSSSTILGTERYGNFSGGKRNLIHNIYVPYLKHQQEIRSRRKLPSKFVIENIRISKLRYSKVVRWF